ncbi:MAG: amino acid/amide transporter substrate-binding protein family [Firmicutes bacterium]|nr:amino acid/amide transporter substrate-binding protein family [Bacillota bacterium]
MKWRSGFGICASVLALSLLLTACGGGATPASSPGPAGAKSTAPGVSDKEIVIGTFGPLTGPAAGWGDTLRGLAAYADFINEQGGVNGRKLRVIIEDDQYQPSKTVGAVKKMVEQDKVFALVNVIGTSNLTAVQDYLVQNKVPVILYSTGSRKFQEPINPYFFAGLMPYEDEAKVLMRFGNDTLKVKKYAVFYQNDDFGKGGLGGAKEAVAKIPGAQIVAEVAYNPADVDVSAYALKMKEAGAEAVLIWGTVKHGALVIKEAKKIGFQPKWLLSGVTAGFQLAELTDGAGEGAYTVASTATLTDTENVVVKEYLANQAKYLKNGPNSTQLGGWSAGRIFVEALKRAGPEPTREQLIKAMETLKDYQGLALVNYSDKDHIGTRKAFVRQLQGNTYVKVTDLIDGSY